MEGELSTGASRRRLVRSVWAVLHPLELAAARTGLEAERRKFASVPQLAATRHEVVGRRRRRRRWGWWWWWRRRGATAYGERGRRRLARDDVDGHRIGTRDLTVRRQPRQRDFMVARLELRERD